MYQLGRSANSGRCIDCMYQVYQPQARPQIKSGYVPDATDSRYGRDGVGSTKKPHKLILFIPSIGDQPKGNYLEVFS